MFFDTPIYFLFLTLVVLAYWCLGWRRQNVMLLVASYVFYGWWDPRFLGLIALSTVVDFYCAKAIANTSETRRRKTLLTISLISRVMLFHLVCLAWIFFRTPSLGEAVAFLGGLGTFVWVPEYGMALRFLALFSLPLFVMDLFNESRGEEYLLEGTLEPVRVAVGVAMMAFVTLVAANQLNAFIYFQF